MPKLRGHHLVCLHFFSGEGYDRTFIENLKAVLLLVESNPVTVMDGADDICKCCCYLEQLRCNYTEDADDEIQWMDRTALDLLGLKECDRIEWSSLREKVKHIFPRWYDLCCSDCSWRGSCEKSSLYGHCLERSGKL